MACGARAEVSNNGGERAATPAVEVAAAVGRGSAARQMEAGAIRKVVGDGNGNGNNEDNNDDAQQLH